MILINTAENRSFEHFSTTMSTPDTTLSHLPPARVSPCGGCPDGVEVCVHQKFVKCSKKHQSSFERFIFEPLIGRFIACFCWWKKVGTPCRNFRWRRSTRDHKRPQETTRDHRFGHVSISLDFHFQSSSHLTELRMFNHFQLCRIMFSKISWLKTRTTPRWWLQTSSKLLAGSSRQVRWKYLPIFETTTWAPRSHIFFGCWGHTLGHPKLSPKWKPPPPNWHSKFKPQKIAIYRYRYMCIYVVYIYIHHQTASNHHNFKKHVVHMSFNYQFQNLGEFVCIFEGGPREGQPIGGRGAGGLRTGIIYEVSPLSTPTSLGGK